MAAPSRFAAVARAGLRRGLIELRNMLQSPADMTFYLFGTAIFVVVLVLNRGATVDDTGLPLIQFILPGALAMVIMFTGTYGPATLIATEREDGTLLRAKAIPGGMTGYVIGQATRTLLELVFSVLVLIVAALILTGGIWNDGALGIARTLLVLLIGALAVIPLGFVIGSLFKNPRSIGGWGFLAIGGLVAVSGVFAPISTLPGWLQPIGLVLPMFWLGHLLRWSMLPETAAVFEPDGLWRIGEGFAVLGGWAVLGLVLAPIVLRRMARRESGSGVQARRESALQRV